MNSNNSNAEPWVGDLHTHSQDVPNDESQPQTWRVAFWAASRAECDALLSEAKTPEPARKVWLENLHTAVEHIGLGSMNSERAFLAKSVSRSQPILFSEAPTAPAVERPKSAQCDDTWAKLLHRFPKVWCAFVAMDAPDLALLLRETRGKSDFAIGILFGAEEPTVHICRANELPGLGERIDDPEDDLTPMFIFPAENGAVNFEHFNEPGLGQLELGAFNRTPTPDEAELLKKVIEKKDNLAMEASALMFEFLPHDAPLMYGAEGQAVLRPLLTRLPDETIEQDTIHNALVLRNPEGQPEFYEMPQVALLELLKDQTFIRDDPALRDAHRRRVVRHALFDATPKGEDKLAFIAKHEKQTLAIAAQVAKTPGVMPYVLFAAQVLPVVIAANDQGLKLDQIPEVAALWENQELSLLQKLELFGNVLEAMSKEEEKEND